VNNIICIIFQNIQRNNIKESPEKCTHLQKRIKELEADLEKSQHENYLLKNKLSGKVLDKYKNASKHQLTESQK